MKKKTALFLILIVATLILEILPFGVKMQFMPSPDANPEDFVEYHSYFDLLPYGYGVFPPLMTAILTVALLILGGIFLWKPKNGLGIAVFTVSCIATVLSFAVLLYVPESYTVTAGFVSALLVGASVLSYFMRKQTV